MMKRLTALLLCMVMLVGLFGCGQITKPPVDPTPTPTGNITPTPEQPSKNPEPTGSPNPTDSPEPPPTQTPEVTPPPGIIHTVDGYEIVYENEELGVTICAVEKGSRIVVHYGTLTQEIADFSYNDQRPDFEVWEQDADGDGTNELYVIHTVGSGTGAEVQKLLVCEPNSDALDYLVHDWSEITKQFHLARVADYDPDTGLVSVIYGEQAVAVVTDPGLNCKDPAAIFGNQVHYFRNENGTVGITLALELISEDSPMSHFSGMSLFLSLQFDGTDIVPVTKPQLGLDYGAPFAFSVIPTHVHEEHPESWYGEFLLSTPVGDRSFSGIQLIEDFTHTELHLADLTGDGAEEFIVMLVPGYGTGTIQHDLHVFDGVTLEEYDVSEVWSLLSEVTSFSSDDRYYYIDAANLLACISKEAAREDLSDVLDALGQRKLLNTMEFFNVHRKLSVDGGKLFLSNECVVIDPWYSYGTLSAALTIREGKLAIDTVFYTAPDGTVVKERQVKDYFRNLLHNGSAENRYLAAMGSIYESPASMDIGLIFYDGFHLGDPGWESFSPDEVAYLLEQGFSRDISAQKRPAEQLDEILNAYFGISLYDVAIPADWVYYPETDSYYSNHNDAYLVHSFTLMDVRETEEGLFELHYYVDPLRGAFDPATGWPVVYGVLTLRPNGNSPISPEGFTVVSNLGAQPIDALIEEGVFLYALPDGQFIMQDGYIAGPVAHVNETNQTHPGYYQLSDAAITGKELEYDWEGEPQYDVVSITIPCGEGRTENADLWWVEELGVWEPAPFQSLGPLGDLMGEVTKDTIPTDPKQFYLVAQNDPFALYARNWGTQALMTWEGNFWWYLGERTTHTARFDLPVMTLINDTTAAVISEVGSGSQMSLKELIVYQVADIPQEDGSVYIGLNEYLYDWRPVAEEFNRNNTIVYDKDTNSIVLYWNDEIHFSGALPYDLSDLLGLEDSFTGALIADGQLVDIVPNSDGSFTLTTWTCIGKSGDGYFSTGDFIYPLWQENGEENTYYPLPTGNSWFRLSWTVSYTGDGFEATDVTVKQNGREDISLKAAIPAEGIYLFRGLGGGAGGTNYLLADGEVLSTAGFGDLISDFRLCDLDGDGENEIAVVGNFYAGAGYTSMLTILDKGENGWGGCTIFPAATASELMETATFTPAGAPNRVIMTLDGYQLMFEVSNEVATRDGTYFASDANLSTAITWGGDGYYLHLPGEVYRSSSQIEMFEQQAAGVQFELRCKLEYDGSGSITWESIGITPPYTYFTVTKRGSGLFELVSEQGVVLFDGFHLPGEKILTYRRDLDLDGAEEFIVLLASGRSDSAVHHDAYVFDGRTMEQVDTSGLESVGMSLFVFFSDDEMFHVHSGEFRQPLYKEDILALYPDIQFLDRVEFWGERSSLAVMYDYIEVSYDCIVGEGGESYGSLRVHLKLEDGQLAPFRIEYVSVEGQYSRYQLTSNSIPGPFIVE